MVGGVEEGGGGGGGRGGGGGGGWGGGGDDACCAYGAVGRESVYARKIVDLSAILNVARLL